MEETSGDIDSWNVGETAVIDPEGEGVGLSVERSESVARVASHDSDGLITEDGVGVEEKTLKESDFVVEYVDEARIDRVALERVMVALMDLVVDGVVV